KKSGKRQSKEQNKHAAQDDKKTFVTRCPRRTRHRRFYIMIYDGMMKEGGEINSYRTIGMLKRANARGKRQALSKFELTSSVFLFSFSANQRNQEKIMSYRLRITLPRHIWLFCCLMVLSVSTTAQETVLDRYVTKPDPSYSWKLEQTVPGNGFTTYVLKLTSQTWRTGTEVDRPVWTHWLTIIKPAKVTSNKALLYINGGNNNDP